MPACSNRRAPFVNADSGASSKEKDTTGLGGAKNSCALYIDDKTVFLILFIGNCALALNTVVTNLLGERYCQNCAKAVLSAVS